MTAPMTLIVNGTPVPKARPSMTRRGQVYTPGGTRKYENLVRQLAALEMRGKAPLRGAARIELPVELAVPQHGREQSNSRRSPARRPQCLID